TAAKFRHPQHVETGEVGDEHVWCRLDRGGQRFHFGLLFLFSHPYPPLSRPAPGPLVAGTLAALVYGPFPRGRFGRAIVSMNADRLAASWSAEKLVFPIGA